MNKQGIAFTNYKINAEWVDANEKVRAFFSIKSDVKVVSLTRLRGDDSGPFVFFESYFHPRIGVTPDADFRQPLYEMLQKEFSIVASISREKIKARLATPITAERLWIKTGEPILIRERFVSDPGDKPIEYNIGFYVAEKFTDSIEIKS